MQIQYTRVDGYKFWWYFFFSLFFNLRNVQCTKNIVLNARLKIIQIFFFREMRCVRHKIHMGLFCAFGLSALNWIFTKSIQSGLEWKHIYFGSKLTSFVLDLSSYMTMSVFDQVYCTSWVLTYFFHLASFYWMFIEGKMFYTCLFI